MDRSERGGFSLLSDLAFPQSCGKDQQGIYRKYAKTIASG